MEDLSDLEDERLVELARTESGRRREAAFRILFSRYAPKIEARFRSRLPNPADAEDLVSQTFTKVWEHIDSFDPELGSFSTWIWTIATNLWRNDLRDHHRNIEYDVTSFSSPRADTDRPLREGKLYLDPDADPDRDRRRRRARRAFLEELRALRPWWRVVLVLREVEGRPYRDIADVVGVPLGTVKSRLQRGRNRLAERLEARGVAPSELEATAWPGMN